MSQYGGYYPNNNTKLEKLLIKYNSTEDLTQKAVIKKQIEFLKKTNTVNK